MPHRLEYYRQQRDLALKQAENDSLDKAGWLRIATEWQTLLDALSAELDRKDQPGDGGSKEHWLD